MIKDSQSARRVPRRPIQKKIGLLVAGTYYLAKTLEIGEGGMLIESPVELKQNQKVVISFRLLNVVQGVILSHVVYIMQPDAKNKTVRYGIEFDLVDFEVRRKLRNFVASNVGESSAQIIKMSRF